MGNKSEKRDEIDIFELISKMLEQGRLFLRAIVKAVLMFFVIQVRRWYVVGTTIAIGVALTLYINSMSKPTYSSYMIGSSLSATCFDINAYLDDLSELSVEKSYVALAKALNLTVSTASKIKSIDGCFLIDKNKDGFYDNIDFNKSFDVTDTTQQIITDRFCVLLDAYDNSIFDSVQKGVCYYLNHIPYVQQLHVKEKQHIINSIKYLEHEIQQLDSFREKGYLADNSLQTQRYGQIFLVSEGDKPELFHEQILTLQHEKQLLETKLELHPKGFAVIKGLTSFSEKENTLFYYVEKIMPTFIIAGLILSLLVYFKKDIKKLVNS